MADPLLHHDIVTTPGTTPRTWLYALHGIFGAGRNWATVMRRLVSERPDWGVLLIDLRQHGASQGFAPPHTIAAAAHDLGQLEQASGMPASALLGHSFGGKVALRRTQDAPPALRQVWIVDSTPQAAEPQGSAWQMLQVVRSLPARFDTRDALIAALTAEGVAGATAQWMATNLERRDDGFYWRFDVDALEALMRDFFRSDLWNVVKAPPPGVELEFVKAESSSVLSGAVLARLMKVTSNGQVHVHRLSGGHWVNADNPDGLVELLSSGLPRS